MPPVLATRKFIETRRICPVLWRSRLHNPAVLKRCDDFNEPKRHEGTNVAADETNSDGSLPAVSRRIRRARTKKPAGWLRGINPSILHWAVSAQRDSAVEFCRYPRDIAATGHRGRSSDRLRVRLLSTNRQVTHNSATRARLRLDMAWAVHASYPMEPTHRIAV